MVYAFDLWRSYPTNSSLLHNSPPRRLHLSQTCYDVFGEKAEKNYPLFRVVSVQDACLEQAITLVIHSLHRTRTGDLNPLPRYQAVDLSLSASEAAGVDIGCQSYYSSRTMCYQGFACATVGADGNRHH